MQALRMKQNISADGYLHIKIPPHFSAKQVELIILPLPDAPAELATPGIKEPEAEWDIDYEASEVGIAQTAHTFELLDQECGPEDATKWK